MKKTIAFITDSHLYQQLIKSTDAEVTKITYEHVEAANLQHLEIVLEDANDRQIDSIVFGGDIGFAVSHEVFFSTVKKYTNDFWILQPISSRSINCSGFPGK